MNGKWQVLWEELIFPVLATAAAAVLGCLFGYDVAKDKFNKPANPVRFIYRNSAGETVYTRDAAGIEYFDDVNSVTAHLHNGMTYFCLNGCRHSPPSVRVNGKITNSATIFKLFEFPPEVPTKKPAAMGVLVSK